MNASDGSNGETLEATAEQCEDSKSNDIANNNDEKVAEKLASMLRVDVDALKSSRQKQLPISIELGTKLSKDFDGKPYLGWVIELPSSEQHLESSLYYKVKYDDDDEEDFTNEEIQPFIAEYIKFKRQNSGDDVQVRVEAQRKRGRPRKHPVQVQVSAEFNGTKPTKRRRGRPRKNRDPSSPVEEDRPRKRERPPKVKDDDSKILIPPKSRKRGRPPKIRELSNHEAEAEEPPDQIAPRKRGRPRKDVKYYSSDDEADDEAEAPRKRGRPRKDVKYYSSDDEAEAEEPPDQIAPRKRGRPRKDVKYYSSKDEAEAEEPPDQIEVDLVRM